MAYIHIPNSQPLFHFNCSISGWVGGDIYVSVSYFLLLTGAVLIELAIAIGIFYCSIKQLAYLCGSLFIIDILGHVGWVLYGSIFLRAAFIEWFNDRSGCSDLIMILSAVTLGVTALSVAICLIFIFLGICCGCYFKCCGGNDDYRKPTVI